MKSLANSLNPCHLNISTFTAAQLYSLLTVALYHYPIYNFAANNLQLGSISSVLTLLSITVVIFIFTQLAGCIFLLINKTLFKTLAVLFAITNAVALYHMITYQVILDPSMISNILNTDYAEASELFHPMIIAYILMLGISPSFIIIQCNITQISRAKLLLKSTAVFILGLVWVYIASSTWPWFDDHAKKLATRVLPWSYVVGTINHYRDANKKVEVQTLLPNAHFLEETSNKPSIEKNIVVLVLGETARAANFSLYGYEKETNPLLKKTDVVALNNPVACSTYTTASLKCILTHQETSWSDSSNFEPLPNYLYRHDVDVIWHSNNWGEPTVNVPNYIKAKQLRADCTGFECAYDGVLLTHLSEKIKSSEKNNILVVIHQKGSHGPSYVKRYPPEVEAFIPICTSVQLQSCSEEELYNVFDNTIVYTDYMLNNVIELLKNINGARTMMMYLSDHGESLGEFNLYLHGTPYSIAPAVQKDIPFLVWMSESFKQYHQVSNQSINKLPSHTQHQVFHSIMGAFSMRSPIYNEQLDIFSAKEK